MDCYTIAYMAAKGHLRPYGNGLLILHRINETISISHAQLYTSDITCSISYPSVAVNGVELEDWMHRIENHQLCAMSCYQQLFMPTAQCIWLVIQIARINTIV